MAEIVLKVGSVSPNPAHWQDGDIIMACNDRLVGCVHSEIICDLRKNPFTSEGLRSTIGLAYKRMELTALYKYTRISKAEVEQLDLVSRATQVFSDIQNAQNQNIHLQEHINYLMAEPTRRVFGAIGAEIFFGAEDRRLKAADINLVWRMIENNTPHKRESFKTMPFSRVEMAHNLMVSIDNMTEIEGTVLVESETVEESFTPAETGIPEIRERIIKRRKRFVNWGRLYSVAEKRSIRDRNIKIDQRGDRTKSRLRASIVEVKT